MPYIKSHSNYVLKKRHQNVNDGTIYERDITTIGGRNNFSKGQVPLYQSGNFVITVNNEDNVQKSVYSQGWEQNDNGEVWTLESLEGLIKDETGSEDQKIVLKQDYYNLRDFAYFGSCSELIRASISDILKKFPGELFVPYDNTKVYTYKFDDTQIELNDDGTTSETTITGLTAETTDYSEVEANNGYDTGSTIVGGIPVFYYDNSGFTGGSEGAVNDDGDGNAKTKIKRLGSDSKFLVDNPFNIDIHTSYIKDSEITQDNFLKYFAGEGYKNYEAIDSEGKAHKFTWSAGSINDGHYCIGNEIAEITITIDNGDEFVIEAWVGNNNKVYYLLDLKKYSNLIATSLNYFSVNSTSNIDYSKQEVGVNATSVNEKLDTAVFKYSLRPKVEFMDEFINNLDSFEKILMNRETMPKYTATFNVIRENDFGYFTDLERFTFPTTYGGYNIGSTGPAYDDYVGNLADIAEFYDERFCDNMYRSMTHESIKNFDWTYLRHRTDEDEEDVKQSGDKVAKIIRLFGRQFDEILAYVDNIKNYNAITYDNINNLPDYFFTDALDGDGWDVKQIIPYTLFEYTGNSKHSDDVSEKTTEEDEKSNSFKHKALHRLFTPDTSFTIKPYTSKLDIYADGYFFGCLCGVDEPVALFDLYKKDNLLDNSATTLNVNVSSTTEVNSITTSTSATVSSTTGEFSSKNVSKYRYFEDEGDGVFSISPTSGESAVTTYIDYGVSSESAFVTTYITSKKGKEITGDTYIDCSGTLRVRIKNYSSENDWTMPAINNEFMKRLIINSKNIWRHKGTQEGVEMILGMFGMKSKRWYDALPEYEKETYKYTFKELSGVRAYDYEIKEYTSFTKRIEDTYIDSLGDYKYNWINQSKNISYGTDEYVPYQGIPVTYRDTNDGKRYLYPNFQKDATYDGNPYYQMNGGWLSVTPYLFDKDDNLVIKKENSNIYNETLRNIRSVNSLQDLFEIPLQNLNDGDIVYVTNLSGEFAVVDGRVYPLEEEYDSDSNSGYTYFTIEVMNSSAIIGNAYFNDYVIVSDPYSVDSKRRYGLADGESDGISIKVYLIKRENISGDSIYAYSDEESVSTFTVFKNGKYMDGEDFTNYFRINDTLYSNELSILGWEQLKTNDYDYYKVNSEKDYYFGNNPHTGHLHYDNGHEYFTYFRHLFRYAYDNSLFNEGVLSEYPRYDDEDLYEDIDDFGFKSLINDDSCQLDYEDFLTEDSKIHYFGNYYNDNGSYEYSLDDKPNKYEYNLSTINPKTIGVEPVDSDSVGYGWMHKPCGDNTVEGETPIDGVTNQIVNNKLVKVIFYIRDDNFYSKTALEEIKYLESVVDPYMTQMMPSGVILGTEYRFVGQGVHSYTIKTVVNGEPVDGLGVEIKNEKTGKWELVGYTEQGVLTFEKEGDMDKIKVRIKGGDSEETTLDLSTYYVASDYTQTPFNIDVITSYKKINFDTTEGEVDADGCLEFNGEMTTNLLGKFFTYEIKYKKGDEWVSDADGWIENSADASETGGTIYLGTKDNNTLDDRDAKIIVKYALAEPKEVQVHQYGNREEVTYTVISNVNDGVYAYFYKDEQTKEPECDPIQFKNGVVEYSKPKVSASTLYVKIEGGLPDSSVAYTLDTEDGSREDVLSSGGIENWSPHFVSGKTTNRYTWDDNADLDARQYSSATTFSIGYDETVEKNYTIMKPEFTDSGVTCILQKPSVDWVAKDCDTCYTSSISANTYNGNRSTVLRYYINEDKSVFLDYKITQGKGEFVFKFNTSVSSIIVSEENDKKASTTTEFTKHRVTIPLKCIDSYATTEENKIGFIASVRDSNTKYTIDENYVYFDLDKNTCTKPRDFTITFIQKISNKRIILTVTQSAVICDVGDVYCYDTSNGNYYFVNVLSGDTIGTNAIPIGITIIPMDNAANTNGEFARIISLTEKNSQTYQRPLWKKSDTGKAQTNDKYEYKWRISSRERVDEDWWVSLGTEGYANTGVLKYKTKLNANGLYYAKTDHHADKPMTRDSNGHYKINNNFKVDVNIGDSRHKNCLCDFMGFQKSQDAYKDGGGELFEMCHNYETVGTNKGEWFLGGAGEMACLVQNIGLINAVIVELDNRGYSVTKFNFDFQPDEGYFKGGPNHGYYCEGYYWTVTNHGRVGGIDSIKSIDPNSGNEFSSWMVALANGTMQWGVHRTGHNQSAGGNQTRARARLMLLVNKQDKHVASESTDGE